MLSIETEGAKYDSKQFVINSEDELYNEREFHGLKEAIKTGPQALSLDFQFDADE